MGGRWQIAAASDWAGFSMGRGGAAAKMDGTIYAHMPRCCTSASAQQARLHLPVIIFIHTLRPFLPQRLLFCFVKILEPILHTRTPLFSECPHAFHLDSLPNWSKQRSSRLPRTGHQQQDSRHHALATLLVIVMAHIVAMPSPPTTPLSALAFSPARLLAVAQRRRSSCLTGGR